MILSSIINLASDLTVGDVVLHYADEAAAYTVQPKLYRTKDEYIFCINELLQGAKQVLFTVQSHLIRSKDKYS